MTRKYSAAQRNYMLAKAAYQASERAVNDAMEPHLELLDTEEGIDQYTSLEMVERERQEMREAFSLLRETEEALLDWSYTRIEHLPQYKQVAGQLDELRQAARRRVTVREQLVSLAMSLDPKN